MNHTARIPSELFEKARQIAASSSDGETHPRALNVIFVAIERLAEDWKKEHKRQAIQEQILKLRKTQTCRQKKKQ
jgi:hypothetical protein